MKKQLLLLTLPALLVSCSNASEYIGEEVSYQTMLIELQHRDVCPKALLVEAKFSLHEDTDNWDIIGYSDETFVTGYEVKNFNDSWNFSISLDINGNIVSEYDPIRLLYKPYLLDWQEVVNIQDAVNETDGLEQVKYYLNPLRVIRTEHQDLTNHNAWYAPTLYVYHERVETFNKYQWLTKCTDYYYYYIYNNETGVRAYDKVTYTSTFKYESYR